MNPLWTMSIYEKTKNSPIFKGLARPLNDIIKDDIVDSIFILPMTDSVLDL